MRAQENGRRMAEVRHVAVLFADVQGFTRLCERLDAEEVVETLNTIYERLGQDVELYGGHIDKVLGDGLMVLFGAPQAHDDNVLRAVLAGLGMQKAMTEFQPWLKEKLGHGLGLRIGIDAGPVVYARVGPGPDPQLTVIGDPANVASRLQRVARPGQVVISERAKRLCSSQIHLRRLGDVRLEGRVSRMVAYVAVAPTVSVDGGREDRGTTLVGRSAELEQLMGLYDRLVEGHGNLVLLTGEGGIGKSRLLAEFLSALRAHPQAEKTQILQIRNQWQVGAVYRPLSSLASALNVQCARLRLRTARGRRSKGADSARPSSEETLMAQVSAICERGPMVIILDDWQWADEDDARRLLRVICSLESRAVLSIVAGRRVELPPDVGGRDGFVVRMHLQPLNRKESWLLLRQTPGSSALPVGIAETLVERSGGNPAHVFEYMRGLVERGAIAPSVDGWRIVDERLAARAPDNLRDGVMSQLDALDPESLYVLRVCSVVGGHIPVRLLASVLGADSTDVEKQLARLVESGLLVRDTQVENAYSFRSGLVRDVTYDTMLKRHRRDLHLQVGEALEKENDASKIELARHFIKARVAEKARCYGLAAGDVLLASGDHEGAFALLTELDDLVSDSDVEARAALLEQLGEACVGTGRWADGLDRFLGALALVRDPKWRGQLSAKIGWVYALQGRNDMAVKHCNRAREMLSSIGGDDTSQMMIEAAMRLLYDRP